MRRKKNKDEQLRRVNKHSILFNEKELKAIDNYCKRFRVKNKSQFMREAIITEILRKYENNHPTLWEDMPQMKLF